LLDFSARTQESVFVADLDEELAQCAACAGKTEVLADGGTDPRPRVLRDLTCFQWARANFGVALAGGGREVGGKAMKRKKLGRDWRIGADLAGVKGGLIWDMVEMYTPSC